MICGLTIPTGGSVKINGMKSGGCSVIGNLIEAPGLYGNMSAEENLKCLALLHGKKSETRIPELLELVGLWVCLILNCILYVMPGLFRLCFPSLFVISDRYSAAGTLLSTVTGGLPCMICAIYSAVFFHDDEKYGFIKNVFPHLMYKTFAS